MQNIKNDTETKFDRDFLEVLERADRKEMFEYRNVIIDEVKYRRNTWQNQLRNSSHQGDLRDLVVTVLLLCVGVLCLMFSVKYFIVGSFAYSDGIGSVLAGVGFLLLAISNFSSAIKFYLVYRGIDIKLITTETMKAETAESGAAEAGTKYAALRRDSDEVLNAKQNRLDSLLGM